MDPIPLSPDLLRHLRALQADTKAWLSRFEGLRSDPRRWARFSTDQQSQLATRQRQLSQLLTLLDEVLENATTGSPDLAPPQSLSALYDQVVELGIQINTKGSPALAQTYLTALDDFLAAYQAADALLQTEWQAANAEVEESRAILQAKLARAAQVRADRQNNGPVGGYFRYVEGTVEGKRYRRLDWLSDMVHFSGEAHRFDDNEENRRYTAGTNRFIIELYQLQPDRQGGWSFSRNGTAYSLSASALELFGQLTGPYRSAQEGMEGHFPALEYNHTPRNRTPRWSVAFQGTTPTEQLSIDLPTWSDYGAQRLITQYRTDCAAFRLTQASSDAAIQAINEAIDQ